MFQLALKLGKTVSELLEQIDSSELSEWIAFSNLHPFEDGYWQAGIISSTIANVHAKKGKKFYPEDFIPKKKTKKRQTVHEMMNIMSTLGNFERKAK